MRSICRGSTSHSETFYCVDAAGAALTGKVAADFTARYRGARGNNVTISLSDLVALNSAYSSGGLKEIGNGEYRLDIPDAAFALSDDNMSASLVPSAGYSQPKEFRLVAVNDQDPVSMGLTGMDASNLLDTTIATLTSQTVFTLNAGASDSLAYRLCEIVIHKSGSTTRKCVGWVSGYVGSTKQVTLVTDPGVFTIAVGDRVTIHASRSVKSAIDDGRTLAINPSNLAIADVRAFIGASLTETTSGQVSASFKKLHDVVTPLMTTDQNGLDLIGYNSQRKSELMIETTIAVVNASTNWVLTSGVLSTGMYNNCWAVVLDADDATKTLQRRGKINGSFSSDGSITFSALTSGGNFTPAVGDTIRIYRGTAMEDTARVRLDATQPDYAPLQPTTPGNKINVSAGGNADANLQLIRSTAITTTSTQVADRFSEFFNRSTSNQTVESVGQSGDAFARLGSPAGASIAADIATRAAPGAQMNLVDGAITAAKIASNAITAAKIAADALTAIANEVENQIIDDTDSEKVLKAITDKIAETNPDLHGLTLGAIASAVQTQIQAYLDNMDAAVSTRLASVAYTAPDNTNIGVAATRATSADNKLTTARLTSLDDLATMISNDGTVNAKFTATALSNAPTGGSGGGPVGPGSILKTLLIKKPDNTTPVSGAEVWISTDVEGGNVIAGTLVTDDFGHVAFMLDPGTYYVWIDHPEFKYSNPAGQTTVS